MYSPRVHCLLPPHPSLSLPFQAMRTEKSKYKFITTVSVWTRVADENRVSPPILCPYANNTSPPFNLSNQSYLAIPFNKLLMLSSIQLKTTFIVVMPTYFTRYYYHYHYHTCLNVLSVHLSFFPFYLEPASKTGNHRIYHCPEPASTPGYYLFKLIL